MDFHDGLLIILGGELTSIEPAELKGVSSVIAVDKGADHAFSLGLLPDVIVGDLDSLSAEVKKYYKQRGIKTISYPPQKDFTDEEAALWEAKKRGAKKIIILAAFGGREDHHLMNIFCAARYSDDFDEIIFPGEGFFAVICPRKYDIHSYQGKNVGLIALSPKVLGISTKGLFYPWRGEDLSFGETRGISNILLEKEGMISYESGKLLLIQSF
ncbi:MAG: thiamine diphosphokinase [Bacillota bacterium]|jgi:thiamine pyrophosphokinase